MAGTNRNFDRDAFVQGIHLAMTMGAAPVEENQVTFHFPSTLVYTGPADAEDVPFDPDVTVTSSNPEPVRVPAAVEYYDASGLLIEPGVAQPTRIRITLLDEDYEQVKDANRVTAGGDTYHYRRTEPPSGLFDVGLFIMHFHAASET